MSRGLGKLERRIIETITKRKEWIWAIDLAGAIWGEDGNTGPISQSVYSSVRRAANTLIKRHLLLSGQPYIELQADLRLKAAYWLPGMAAPFCRRGFGGRRIDGLILAALEKAGTLERADLRKSVLSDLRSPFGTSEADRILPHFYLALKRLVADGRIRMYQDGPDYDRKWHSLGVNITHGLQRTRADKQRAIESAIRHPLAGGKTQQEIADHVGCSRSWVSEVCTKLGVKCGEQLSEPTNGPERPREVKLKNGATYIRNTANSGRKKTIEPPVVDFSLHRAAAAVGVSPDMILRAERIQQEAPDLAERCWAGTLTIEEAEVKVVAARVVEDHGKSKAGLVADLAKGAGVSEEHIRHAIHTWKDDPELYKRVDRGAITAPEAEGLIRQAKAKAAQVVAEARASLERHYKREAEAELIKLKRALSSAASIRTSVSRIHPPLAARACSPEELMAIAKEIRAAGRALLNFGDEFARLARVVGVAAAPVDIQSDPATEAVQ